MCDNLNFNELFLYADGDTLSYKFEKAETSDSVKTTTIPKSDYDFSTSLNQYKMSKCSNIQSSGY